MEIKNCKKDYHPNDCIWIFDNTRRRLVCVRCSTTRELKCITRIYEATGECIDPLDDHLFPFELEEDNDQ